MRPRTSFMQRRSRAMRIDSCAVTRTGAVYDCWLEQGAARPRYLQPENIPIEVYRLLTEPTADIKAGDFFVHRGNTFYVILAEQPPPVTNLVQRTFLCYLTSNGDGTSGLVVPNATVKGYKSDKTTVRYDSRRVTIATPTSPTETDTPEGTRQLGNYMIDVAESTWVARDYIEVLSLDGQPDILDTSGLVLMVVDRPAGADARVVALLDGDFHHRVRGT